MPQPENNKNAEHGNNIELRKLNCSVNGSCVTNTTIIEDQNKGRGMMKSSEDINAINVDKSTHPAGLNSLNGSKRSNNRYESILKSGTSTFKPIEEQGKRILPTLADKQNLEITG